MPYTIYKSNGSLLTELANQTITNTVVSLGLVGKGAIDYGTTFSENFVFLLENFASNNPPGYPLTGQIWYDTSINKLKSFNGAIWSPIGIHGLGNTYTASSGGPTLGGGTAGANRGGGSTGIVLINGVNSTTVGVTIGEGRIITASCTETIEADDLPATVTIDGVAYAFAARFGAGLRPGLNLAAGQGYVFFGPATSVAADVAERYEVEGSVEPGDVVEIGGSKEIRKTTKSESTDVFGVISTAPAIKMNDAAGNDSTHPYVALVGRIPCKVDGMVAKGQRLVSSSKSGVAKAASDDSPHYSIIGRALEDKTTDGVGKIQIVLK